MLRGMLSLILIFAVISLSTGCNLVKQAAKSEVRPEDVLVDPKIKVQSQINKIGNTEGNLSNDGLVAKQGKWIYYSLPYSFISENNEGLFKVKEDGLVNIKICDDTAAYINVVGDWIYYASANDHYKLKKIKTNGSESTLLSQDKIRWMIVKENVIYYTDGIGIFSCNTDGSGKTTILGNINMQIDFFELQNGYAFLKTTGDNNQNQELSVINLKTLIRRKLHEGTYLSVFTDNQWFYFIDSDKDCNIFKMKLNGTGLAKLTDQPVSCLNNDENHIYFISDSSTYSIDKDGRNMKDLHTLVLNSYLHTFDNYLYYFSISRLESKNLK